MQKNKLKAILFQLNENQQFNFRYQQFIKFVKSFSYKELKIGLILPAHMKNFSSTRINPLIEAAKSLKVLPMETMIFLSNPECVHIARNDGFGLIANWHSTPEEDLVSFQHGSDILIENLNLLDPEWISKWFTRKPTPFKKSQRIYTEKQEGFMINPCYSITGPKIMQKKDKPVFFFDYDGTLTPIMERQELAILDPAMKNMLLRLSKKYQIALISGREKSDLMKLVDIPNIFYAGNHGLNISGPGISMTFPGIENFLPIVKTITYHLEQLLYAFPGVILEKKNMSIAVHYRMTPNENLPELKNRIKKVLTGQLKYIRILKGKKVFEFLPNIEWNKGRTIAWIMDVLGISWVDHRVFYLGDDTTDEDAFRVLRTRGIGILVSEKTRKSSADFRLSSPEEVKKLIQSFLY